MSDMLFAVASINLALFIASIVIALLIIRSSSLLSATVLTGFFSLLMTLLWVNMGAMDVAFTEAAVSAGISTILLIAALSVMGFDERPRPVRFGTIAKLVLFIVAGLLLYGTLDMPRFGDPDAPIHTLRAPDYIQQTVGGRSRHHQALASFGKMQQSESLSSIDPIVTAGSTHAGDFGGHAPNFVTTLLAAYRGFDTMFETSVIFSAGLSLILLIKPLRRQRHKKRRLKGEIDLAAEEELFDE